MMRVTSAKGLFCLLLLSGVIHCPGVSGQAFKDKEIEQFASASEYRKVITLAQLRLAGLRSEEYPKRNYYINHEGLAYFRIGNFDSAFISGKQLISGKSNIQDSAAISDGWKLLAYVYNRRGDFDSALFYSRILLSYAVRNNKPELKANALTSLATILMQNKRYREALKYNREAYALNKSAGNINSVAASEYNIGLAYLNLKMPDSSLYYLERSLETSNHLKKTDLDAYIYDGIAECYFLKGDLQRWKEFMGKSIKAAQISGNPHFVALTLSQLGQQALTASDYQVAYDYLLRAHKTLSNRPFPALQIRVDSMLYVASRRQNRFKEALQWLESYTEFQKKMFNSRQAEALNNLVLKIETAEKNLKIKEKEAEVVRMKQKYTMLIGGIVLLLLFFSGVILYLMITHRYRNRLFIQNKLLEKQQQLAMNLVAISAPSDTGTDHSSSIDNEAEEPNPNKRNLEIYNRLLSLFEKEKLFLDPELNVKAVQMKLGTNKKYLYEAIAVFSGTNFRGLINRYRVNEFRIKLESAVRSGQEMSLNQMAYSSGFNSYASFYRIFREHTGLSPAEYISELKKEHRKPR